MLDGSAHSINIFCASEPHFCYELICEPLPVNFWENHYLNRNLIYMNGKCCMNKILFIYFQSTGVFFLFKGKIHSLYWYVSFCSRVYFFISLKQQFVFFDESSSKLSGAFRIRHSKNTWSIHVKKDLYIQKGPLFFKR